LGSHSQKMCVRRSANLEKLVGKRGQIWVKSMRVDWYTQEVPLAAEGVSMSKLKKQKGEGTQGHN